MDDWEKAIAESLKSYQQDKQLRELEEQTIRERLQQKQRELDQKNLSFYASTQRIKQLEQSLNTIRLEVSTRNPQFNIHQSLRDLSDSYGATQQHERLITEKRLRKEQLEREVRALSDNLKNVKSDLMEVVQDSKLSVSVVQDHDNEKGELLSKLKQIQDEHDRTLEEKVALEREWENFQSMLNEKSELTQSVVATRDSIADKLEQNHEKINDLRNYYEEKVNELKLLEEKHEKLKAYTNSFQDKCKKELSSVEERSNNATNRLVTAGKALNDAKIKHEILTNEKNMMEELINQKSAELEKIAKDLMEKNKGDEESKNRIASMRNMLQMLEKKYVDLSNEVIASKNKLDSDVAQYEEVYQKLDETNRKICTIEQELQENTELMNVTLSQIGDTNLNELETKKKDYENIIKELMEQVNNLTNNLKESEDLIRGNMENIDNKELELIDTQQHINETTQRLEALTNEYQSIMKNEVLQTEKEMEHISTIEELTKSNADYLDQHTQLAQYSESVSNDVREKEQNVLNLNHVIDAERKKEEIRQQEVVKLTELSNQQLLEIQDLQDRIHSVNQELEESALQSSNPEFEKLEQTYEKLLQNYTNEKNEYEYSHTNSNELNTIEIQLENIEDLFPRLNGNGNVEERMINLLNLCQVRI
eukprot:TRINITY_DN8720_c0_g1_i2.p1 TRINITY_DN8720_c0_g1~~TRINITY_DN8720_c0_g1_i2.p1  ORF type:complete len:651 (+),score=175.68 TRINITY_DN8720_c0_g1_i2:37-1989(+)